MPDFAKSHNSGNILQNLFESYQVLFSSSPISWPSFKPLVQIVFVSLKCSNLQEPYLWKKLTEFNHQVMYSSFPISYQISSPCLKYISRNLSDKFKMPKFAKGHKSGGKNDGICLKVNQAIYSSSRIGWPSFKPHTRIVFKISCRQDFILIFLKGHNSGSTNLQDKKKIGVH